MGRISISTTVFSKAYLATAWKDRGELQDYEKRGFGQFFYLTICSHLESVIAEIIQKRLESIQFMVGWETLPPIQFEVDNQIQEYSLSPVYTSLLSIVAQIKNDSHNAHLMRLIEIYNRVFSPSIRDVLGKNLYEDLMALASLRNLFAHGRELFFEIEDLSKDLSKAKLTLDANPLHQPAQRLHEAGLIKNMNITGQNYSEFESVFYGDGALLYFYKVAKQIEERLKESVAFFPEKDFFTTPGLPELEP